MKVKNASQDQSKQDKSKQTSAKPLKSKQDKSEQNNSKQGKEQAQLYSKKQFLVKYSGVRRDLVDSLLEEPRKYSIVEVDKMLQKFLNKGAE